MLLDDGWSCARIAAELFFDDDTIRRWQALFLEDGLEGLRSFDAGGSSSRLSVSQQEALIAWITAPCRARRARWAPTSLANAAARAACATPASFACARALCGAVNTEQCWTPIWGQKCEPIDTSPRARYARPDAPNGLRPSGSQRDQGQTALDKTTVRATADAL